MDLGSLLGSVLKESLGMRGKRHESATSFLLRGVRKRPGVALGAAVGAAGLAYGLWERSQREQRAREAGGGHGAAGAAPPPLPSQAGHASASPPPSARGTQSQPPPLPPEAGASVRQMRVIMAAAQADGAVTSGEMKRVLEAAREAGAEASLLRELEMPSDVRALVAAAGDAEREDLYALAFAVVRCDEDVTDAERGWLAELAEALKLDAQQVQAIEEEVVEGIGPAC